ncbi:hypothetical protein [Pseudaestuariivita atlantica]|uniref:Lipoprotein n=1 Tax=Pseudaestuariivita atlantica TaxID=1317121 RepID=A0A0L1JQY1_9RHOB|nr:hypothetical protein [Pseudaestuariivita atlantica]KNG94199.1 hypothetical protein ATO11_08225 [Pseudaestuariivita atlantica]
MMDFSARLGTGFGMAALVLQGCATLGIPEPAYFIVNDQSFRGTCAPVLVGPYEDQRRDGSKIRWCSVSVNGFSISCERSDCAEAIRRTLERQERERREAQMSTPSNRSDDPYTPPDEPYTPPDDPYTPPDEPDTPTTGGEDGDFTDPDT